MWLVGIGADIASPGSRRDSEERLLVRTDIEWRPLTTGHDVVPQDIMMEVAAIGISIEDD